MYHTNDRIRTATSVNDSSGVGSTAQTIPVFAQRVGSWQLSVQRLPFSSLELTHRYDRAAATWSQTLNRLHYPRAYDMLLRNAFSEYALDAVEARPRVLECGVGTGALSSVLADVMPMPCSLDAIDISPGMLAQAKRRFDDSNMDVKLRQGDVRELPYADGIFDLAMAAHVLEHLVEPGEALNEMIRVLKPGGLLIACITRRSTLGMLVHLKWRTHRVTPAQAESWLLDRGLENVRCISLGDQAFCRQLSVGCVGRKPRAVHQRA